MSTSGTSGPFPQRQPGVSISGGKGIVGINYGTVNQTLQSTPQEQPVDLIAAAKLYRQRVIATYNRLNYTGFERSKLLLSNVSLEQIFIRLNLMVEKPSSRREEREEKAEPQPSRREREEGKSPGLVEEPISLAQALKNDLLLVGEPGCGKTTLLHWLAVTFIQGCQRDENRVGPDAEEKRLPILVELGPLSREYARSGSRSIPNWLDFLPKFITGQTPFHGVPAQLLKIALEDGYCLLLFDGLDEIADPSVREDFARSLATLKLSEDSALHRRHNRIVIGCRTTGADENERYLRLYQRCQIARFTLNDVQKFFTFWYTKAPELAGKQPKNDVGVLCNKVLKTPALLQLATTPLLAMMLLVIWYNDGTLPEHRVELYERCCQGLLKDWVKHHQVFRQSILNQCGWEDYLRLLAPLAYTLHTTYTLHSDQKRKSTTKKELIARLAKELQAQRLVSNTEAAWREAEHCLEELSLHSGLIHKEGDEYRFAHHTFQEYLAARYIATLNEKECIKLVMQHLHKAWWQQIHLLVMGYLGSPKLFSHIVHQYPKPSRFWERPRTLPSAALGRRFPAVALESRVTWLVGRNLTLCLRGLKECPAKENAALQAFSVELKNHVLDFIQFCLHNKADRHLSAFLLHLDGALPAQEQREVLDTLFVILRDTEQDEYVRAAIAKSLGQLGKGNPHVLRVLKATLAYPKSLAVANAVADSLGELLSGESTAIRELWEQLQNEEDTFFSVYSAEILGKVVVGNQSFIEFLLANLHNHKEHIRFSSSLALAQIEISDPQVLHKLLEAFFSEEKEGVRRNLVETLGNVKGNTLEVLKSLLKALDDPDGVVREYVYRYLERLGKGNADVIRRLCSLIIHEQRAGWEKRNAIDCLSQIGIGSDEALDTLIMVLTYPEDYILQDEAGGMSPEMRELVEELGNSWADIQIGAILDLQEASIRGLGHVAAGHKEVVATLLSLLRDSNHSKRLRAAAAESLGWLGAKNETIKQALLDALHPCYEQILYAIEITAAAARSLGQLGVGDQQVISALLERLNDPAEEVRLAAAKSLGQVVVGEHLPREILIALNRCWYDSDEDVCRAALAAMAQILEGRSFD